MIVTVICLGVSVLLVIIDQLIKLWALGNLVDAPSVVLIPGFLQLTYLENRGAAYGILQNQTTFLSIVTTIIIGFVIYLILSKKISHPFMIACASLIIAGGTGNLIDRVFRGFVVDYLDITPLFQFPVFNFADSCVVVGTILFAGYILLFEGKKNDQDH